MQKQIGRYVLETELGRGGFGKVFRAFDPTVGRRVAIKTLTAEGDAETLIRFRNEAASAGRLHHRNIVTIYDYGEAHGEPYIVMELLEGRDLQSIIAQKAPLPLAEKMRVMSEVAEGLQHAHRHGIVHRDIKPANIMVMPDRSVKIMDFGIALVSQAATRLTKSGMVPGTLKYMAPEQFKGSLTDALSDIFAYAVTYYEFLTGAHPFDAPTNPAVMFRIVGSEPDPIQQHLADCPELLDHVILRALSKDRDLRYQTLEDLQFDLRPVLADLERQQARGLVEEARRQAELGHSDEAQSLIRRILTLDPANAEAAALRRQFQSGRHTQTVRAKVEEMLRTGRHRLESGKFQEAIQTLEDILRLDATNPHAQQLMETARDSLRKTQHSRRLVQQAREALTAGDAQSAIDAASKALASDPTNTEAIELTRTARSALEQAQLAEESRAHRAAQLEIALNALHQDRPTEALSVLDALQSSDPHDVEVIALREQAAHAVDAGARRKSIARVSSEARQLASANAHEPALRKLEDALRQFPGDPGILRLRDEVTAQRDSRDREQKRQDALRQIRELRSANRNAEALELAEQTRDAFRNDTAIVALTQQIRAEVERSVALEQLRALLSAGKVADAARRVGEAFVQFPGDEELTQLQSEILHETAVQTKREEIAAAIAEARALQQKGAMEEAIAAIDEGLRRYPSDPDLTVERDLALTAREKRERQLALKQAVDVMDRLFREQRLEECQQQLDAARNRLGDEAALLNWHKRIRDAMDHHAARTALESARTQIAAGLLDEAISSLDDALARQPGESALRRLRADAAGQLRARNRLRLLTDVDALEKSGQIAEAGELLRSGIDAAGSDPELQALQQRLSSAAKPAAGQDHAPEPPPNRSLMWVALAGVLTVAGGGGYYFTRPPAPATATQMRQAKAESPAKPTATAASRTAAGEAGAKTEAPAPPSATPTVVTPTVARPTVAMSTQASGKTTSEAVAVPKSAPASESPKPLAGAAPRTQVAVVKEQSPASEARPNDDLAWAALNKKDPAALRDFAARFPASRNAREAQQTATQIETEAQEIERQKRAQTEAALREAERLRKAQAEATSRAAEEAKRADTLRAERNAIYAALARYASAFDQKDVVALQSAWPEIPASSLDGLKRAFQDKNVRMTMSLQPLADPEIRENAASIVAQLSTITIQKGRPSNSPARKATIQLVKRNSIWVIQSIQN